MSLTPRASGIMNSIAILWFSNFSCICDLIALIYYSISCGYWNPLKKIMANQTPFDPFFLYDLIGGLIWNFLFNHKPNKKFWFDLKTTQKQNKSQKNRLNTQKTQTKKFLNKINQTHRKDEHQEHWTWTLQHGFQKD